MSSGLKAGDWYQEKLYVDENLVGGGYAQNFLVTEVLVDTQTDFQELVIFKTPTFGTVMALDGIIQTTEKDEYVYHEMLTHTPMFAHGNIRDVLIIGGGDGGILREVLRHKSVEKAVMVELDGGVVDYSKQFLPSLSDGAFDDARTELLIADGIKYVTETENSFDLIIVDSTDPIGPGEVLFTDEFYRHCKRILNKGGLLCTQNGVPFFQPDEVETTTRRLTPIFGDVTFYAAVVPTYIGGFMTLAWASEDESLKSVTEEVLQERFEAEGFKTKYYSPAVHRAAFSLPTFIQDLMVK